MSNCKQGIFSLCVIIFLAVFAVSTILTFAENAEARSFDLQHSTDNNIIEQRQQAEFTINITNLQNYSDTFKTSIDDSLWVVSSNPLYAYQTQYGFSVNSKESSSFRLFLKPISNLSYGVYRVRFYIESRNTGESQDNELFVIMKPNASFVAGYLPAVRATVDITDESRVDPRKPVVISINLDNQNPLNIPDLRISVRTLNSKIIDEEIQTQLSPLEQKTEKITIKLNPLQEPVKDLLEINLLRGSEILKTFKKEFEIVQYSDVEKTKEIKKNFLRTKTTIIIRNNANTANISEIREATSFFRNFFIKSIPDNYKISENEKAFVVWKIDLKPEESTRIEIVEDYRFFTLAVMIVVTAIILYFVLRSPIVVKKEASISSTKDGGISELKILIYIRNRTGNQIKNVRIVDKVNVIAELKDEFVMGTLKPTKVTKHEKKGTMLEWDISVLEGYEERIISYRIKSKLSILGFFNLPPVMLKYRKKNGKEAVVFSNKVRAVNT